MKGQMTIVGILMVFVTLVVFSSLAGSFQNAINNLTEETDATTDILANLIPLFIIIAIVMSIFAYGRPHYERET